MQTVSQYSGNNWLLAALPAEDFALFFSALEPIALPLRHTLQDATQPIEHVYFIEEGVCSILNIMTDGSTIEVGMIGNEGMVGVSALLGGGLLHM
jgi:CRP-like cAMP-binding protein